MSFEFTTNDYKIIGEILNTEPMHLSDMYRYEILKDNPVRRLSLEIYPNIQIGKNIGNLISLYSINSHLQLQFCNGYVASEMLGEITFYSDSENKISGLIIEKEGGCSLFANVDKSVLSGDFANLAPEIMMSSIALSLTETSFDELNED